jgi:uncharacterized protein YbjT (DUF2867 family)
MKIIVTGATGMVGSEVIRQALADKAFEKVTAIVRKPLAIEHPKLKTVIHKDFLDYSALTEVFKSHDACVWCLGISQNQVDEKQYTIITYDYMVAGAKAMLAANPSIGLLFLSGEGASSEEKSRFLFGRVKGKTENALLAMPFKTFHIARPAGILPVNGTENVPLVLKLQYLLTRIFRYITPVYVITSVGLARALLHIVKNGAGKTILTYRDLNVMAKNIG